MDQRTEDRASASIREVDMTNLRDRRYRRSRKNSRNSFAASLSPTAEYTSGV